VNHPKWLVAALCALLIVFSTACSCTDQVAGLFKRQTKTPTPAITPTAVVTRPLVVTDKPDTAFEGEMSAAEIETLLQEQITGEAGEYISDLHVQITPEVVLARLHITLKEMNVSFDMTAAGVPEVVDGKIYLKVTQITFEDTLTGWARLSAKSIVQKALDEYSGENGIPIELDNLYIEAVELRTDVIYIRGRTLEP